MSIFRSKTFKCLIFSILGLIVLLIAFLGSLPSIVSTSWGKKQVLSLINSVSKGSISVDRLDLNWFGPQKIESFTYSEEGREIVSFAQFESDASLFRLLFCRYDFGHATLLNPKIYLRDLQEGELALKKGRRHLIFPKFCGDLDIEGGTLTLDGPRLEPIIVSDISIQLKEAPKVFHIVGKTQQGGVFGDVLISGTLGEKTHVMAKVNQIPVALLDQMRGTPFYTAALGRTLSFDLDLLKTDEAFTLSGKVHAPNLKGFYRGKTASGNFYLDPSSELTFAVTPAFFGQLFKAAEAHEWALANKTNLTVKFEQLVIPLTLKTPDLSRIPFTATLSLQRAELAHETVGMFSLNNMEAKLTSQDGVRLSYSGDIQGKGARSRVEGGVQLEPSGKVTFQSTSSAFPTDLLELITDDAAYLRKVLGNNFSLVLEGSLENNTLSTQLAIGSTRLQLSGSVGGSLRSLDVHLGGKVLLNSKEEAIYGPSPDITIDGEGVFKNWRFALPHFSSKVANAYWDAEITGKLGEKGKPFSYEQVSLKAKGVLHDLPLEAAVVENGDFSIIFDGQKNRIDADIKLFTAIEGVKNNRALEASMHIEDFIRNGELDFTRSNAKFDGNFKKFPVVLLTPFTGDLTGLIGSSMDLKVQSSYSPQEEPRWKLEVDGSASGLKTRLSVALDGTLKVQQDKSAFVRWEMSPSRYQALMRFLYPDQEPDFILMHKASVSLNIQQFTCPATPPKSAVAFLCESGFVGDIDLGDMFFKSRKTGGQVSLKNVRAEIKGENFSEAISVLASGDIQSDVTPKGERSGFKFDGELLGLWTPERGFDKQALVWKGDLMLDYIPVHSITSIIPIDPETRRYVQALLGELVNAHIYGEIAQLSGPLTVDIKSSNFKATLPVQLGGGYLTLREAVEAELTLTPAVNEVLLVDVNPLLITGAWSDHPMRLYIDAQGFAVPIENYSLQGVQIANMVIDLGKIRVRNGGDIQSLMQFLKAKEVSPDGIMEAWFTPIYLSLQNGVASYRRFDALFGKSVHIALWGKIDLVGDKVRMTLGIAPSTLERRFKVKGLSSKDMFQVKMRGTTGNLELDWSSAKTRIGIIIAKSAAGGLGAIVGGILEQIVSALGEEPTPAPTTQPFPWQVEQSQIYYQRPDFIRS